MGMLVANPTFIGFVSLLVLLAASAVLLGLRFRVLSAMLVALVVAAPAWFVVHHEASRARQAGDAPGGAESPPASGEAVPGIEAEVRPAHLLTPGPARTGAARRSDGKAAGGPAMKPSPASEPAEIDSAGSRNLQTPLGLPPAPAAALAPARPSILAPNGSARAGARAEALGRPELPAPPRRPSRVVPIAALARERWEAPPPAAIQAP